jgi:hypothetical protein
MHILHGIGVTCGEGGRGGGKCLPNISSTSEECLFGYLVAEGQLKKIGVTVRERGICILRTGSNQSYTSF